MKKIIKFFRKYQLIIILSLIASFLVAYKILFVQPYQDQETSLTTPAPTPSPTSVPVSTGQGVEEEKIAREQGEKFPLSPYLPYPDQEITIIYTAPLEIKISYQTTLTIEKRNEVLNWIRNQDIDPQTHNILWEKLE